MKSLKLKQFIDEIQFNNRNPKDNTVLNLLDDVRTNPGLKLLKSEKLYRARIFSGTPPKKSSNHFYGYSAKESFVPPRARAMDLRANYRYIPYLYCADHPYGAVCETRPRYGAEISVAEIEVTEDMEIFDLTFKEKPKGMSETKSNLCTDLSDLFSKPVTKNDELIDYIPTQYIAEYIKNLGYGGIYYKCVYSEACRNIVIFTYDRCRPVSSYRYRVGNLCVGVVPSENQARPFAITCMPESVPAAEK